MRAINNNRLGKFFGAFLIILTMFGSLGGVAWADTQDDMELCPGANGQDDAAHQNASETERVTLTTDRLYVEADEINYDLESGLAEAHGAVRVMIDGAQYDTETLTYNVTEATGTVTAFKGEIQSDESRSYLITGKGAVLREDTVVISDATLTRCPHKWPDYLFTAKEMTIRGENIRLKHVILRIKGVPAFYLPRLSFDQGTQFPDVHVGVGGDDGVYLTTGYDAPLTKHLNWFVDTKLSLKDESWAGLGVQTANLPYSNRIRMAYKFDGFWELSDSFTYEMDDWRFVASGFRQFSDSEEQQLGMTLTRKYWESPWGRWQIGGLVRDHTKEVAGQAYGGVYTGIRLDYNPHPYVILSYLGITSHTDREFGDLLEDEKFGLGDNWLYNVNIPVSQKKYIFGMNGVYNSDGEGWIQQVFSIAKQSCAIRTVIGYDTADQSWELSWRLKF